VTIDLKKPIRSIKDLKLFISFIEFCALKDPKVLELTQYSDKFKICSILEDSPLFTKSEFKTELSLLDQ
jgi:hypothetical protein